MNIGYKLFERDMRDNKLYPLFIGKNEETKIGEWLKAEYIPTKGFSNRFGWHLGLVPSAPWLMRQWAPQAALFGLPAARCNP